MKIGIDISQIIYEGTGVAVYTRSLVEALLGVDQENEYVLFGSSLRNRRPLSEFVKRLGASNVQRKFSVLPPKLLEFLWNGIHILPVENFTGEIDVWHSSDWLEPPTRQAKKVTTIHDLTVFKYPETFTPRGGHNIIENQKRKLHFVKHYSDLVIAVSEATKKDIIEVLGLSEKKIKVIYEAAGKNYFQRSAEAVEAVKRKFQIEGDFLLCVGTREPRKNLETAVLAFAEIAGANKDLFLVIAGKYGWGEESLRVKLQSSKLGQRVKILGFVEEEDLARLYSGATAFIYPSFYEGFGLPILEAMSCGCPVITSNLGAMKEIAGEAAILVNPKSSEEIAGAISKIYRSQKTAQEMKLKSLRRAKEFSWEKTALETLRVYQSLVG